jgi:hypothetical protein
MKPMFFISLIITLSFIGNSYAIDVPPPPIDIDISNSSFEKINSKSFKVRQLIAPDYPGTYWVDFLWNPDLLNFEPTNVGEETTPYGKHRVAIVDKSGKFYSDPIAAINNIDTWCGTPSEMNPCMVKILPGVYDIGTNTLQMHHYVDIEGSGEKVTKIVGHGVNNALSHWVVSMAEAEIRFLTVENTGGGDKSIAVLSGSGFNTKMTNITLIVTGGFTRNYGFLGDADFITSSSSLKMTNVTIITKGNPVNYGIFKSIDSSLLEMKNVSITVSGGETNYGAYIDGGTTIDSSTLRADTVIYNSGGTVGVTNTLIDGLVSGPGTTKCSGVYDENYTFYADTCP